MKEYAIQIVTIIILVAAITALEISKVVPETSEFITMY